MVWLLCMMNCKGCGRKRARPGVLVSPYHELRDRRKPRQIRATSMYHELITLGGIRNTNILPNSSDRKDYVNEKCQ